VPLGSFEEAHLRPWVGGITAAAALVLPVPRGGAGTRSRHVCVFLTGVPIVCRLELKVGWSLLFLQVPSDDPRHILSSHHVTVVVRLAIRTVEFAEVRLGHEAFAISRTLFRSIILIQSDDIP
jgi:hypothetical protein